MRNEIESKSENKEQNPGKKEVRNPWLWIPSLYFAEGIPYVIVITLSLIMYKRLGISNTDITLYTSLLYLPWVIKPLWSPIIEIIRTKRYWIVITQLLIGTTLACVAFTIPASRFFQYTLALFWLLAFSSATHDIAADGFYMLGLDQGKQSYFVGIRSTFYKLAMMAGQGLLVIIAGSLESGTGQEPVYLNVQAVQNKEIKVQEVIKPEDSSSKGFSTRQITEISLQNLENSYADSLKADIKSRNISNGFYQKEKKQTNVKSNQSLWEKSVSMPLTNFLKKHFGKNKAKTEKTRTGNLGIAWLKMDKKPMPGEKIVLNLSWKSGSSDISLIEGTRLEFDENNWNKVAYVVFQLDPKLDKPCKTTFIGRSGNISKAWSITFILIAVIFIAFGIYHRFILPYPLADQTAKKTSGKDLLITFFKVFGDFFRRKQIGLVLAFILSYRLAESQLLKLAAPFMLDSTELGGLGLTTSQLGIYYGTIGILALIVGGILGGIVISRNGLKYWIWWMVAAIHIPDLIFVYFSIAKPESQILIASGVALEQFGYGFGFTAFMMYIIYIVDGPYKTAHYAIATGFMALGMMLPGMISGWLQEIIGYQNFFIWVVLCTIPGFIIIAFLKIDPDFGKIKKIKVNN